MKFKQTQREKNEEAGLIQDLGGYAFDDYEIDEQFHNQAVCFLCKEHEQKIGETETTHSENESSQKCGYKNCQEFASCTYFFMRRI